MEIFIDTSNSEKVVLKLNGKRHSTDARIQKAQTLLPFLIECLSKESAGLQDIKEINVHTGPGSFTGLRVGVAIANALGWALNKPVNGEKISKKHFTQINYTSNQ